MSKLRLPTIIAILVLIVGVGLGVFLVQQSQRFRLGASPDFAPQDVRVTNITATSFAVSWITDKPTVGFVVWGKSTNSFPNTASPAIAEQVNTHYIKVEGLSPQTTSYFKIKSADAEYDNSGIPWSQLTASSLAPSGKTGVISGSVLTAGGQAAEGVIVVITAGRVSPLSAQTTSSGTFLIPLAEARTDDLTAYAQIEGRTPLMEIFVQAGEQGVASAQVYPEGASPVPPIILGQTHDFRTTQTSGQGELPAPEINLPEEATQESGFVVPEGTGSAKTTETVTLESIDQGEIVTTTEPEFFGSGPPGTKITITVESTPQVKTLTVGGTGDWSWSPPSNLEPGEHSVTIRWTDAGGILRTLTRTFTVAASEGPAFESTPSASPIASPTATPKATASPSATPRVSFPSTEAGVPQSGVSTPTLLLGLTSFFLVGLGIALWKYNP